MKTHTPEFKQELTKMGKQIDSIITYGQTTLHDELFAVTPMFEGNLLKSIMKQLDVESSVNIPLGTVIKYQLGIKIDDEYEYLDYGNYVVTESEKQEDKNTYKITCYDKMIYAMKEYDEIAGTYPMTIKEYLAALATKIGLTLTDTNFINYALPIPTDLYKGLGYTYRDVLDEIAQATGSMIIINEDDMLEVKYPSISGDTIDENYLKDINVNFGQKYGPINSIVLSRAAESDNVYIQDTESIAQNGLCEVKIVDNQIMNDNNRSDFLQGLLTALDGIEYYINDFDSLGILYYEIGDFYNIQIDNTTYKCLMLNDEIDVTQGLEEKIYTDMPEETNTDYTKADKTDRRINQTYLIVDKQNQTIQSVVSDVTAQDNKISQITQTVEDINSKIGEISNITVSAESETVASVTLNDINESEPIAVKIHPVNESIRYLHPRTTLYPSTTQYLKNRYIRFRRTYTEGGTTKTQNIDYELPDDLLYYDSTHYDEFFLDYENQVCQVTKRCGYNADGTVYVLSSEVVHTYTYPSIILLEGDYTVTIPSYQHAYMYVRLMAKNVYTTQFYTKAETNSLISQTASSINFSVDQKLSNYSNTNAMNSAINIKANEITSTVNETYATKTELSQTSTTLSSRITQTSNSITAEVTRATNAENTLSGRINLKIDKTDNGQIISMINASADRITLTAGRLVITSGNFKLNANGDITASNANITGTINSSSGTIGGFTIGSSSITAEGGGYRVFIGNGSGSNADFLVVRTGSSGSYQYPFFVRANGSMYASNATISGNITATSGTFQNCTITNSCSVPASTITGTLSSSTIPNLSAGKITSGTMSADRISGGTLSGVTIDAGIIGADTFQGSYFYGDIITVNNSLTGRYDIGSYTGKSFQLIVQHEGNQWRRLTFVGGILVKVESEW